MDGQNWEPVIIRKKGGGGGGSGSGGGGGGGGGGPAISAAAAAARRLEEDDIPRAAPPPSLDLRIAISQARCAKKNPDGSTFTQKQLAQAIAEQQTVVNDVESGRLNPSPQLISKIERALGVKLPRPAKK